MAGKRLGDGARVAICAALCVLTLLSLASPLGAAETSQSAVLPFAGIWALGAVGLWCLYRKRYLVFWGEKTACPIRLWLLSALFAGVVTLGQSFLAVGTAELVAAHKLRSLLIFAGRVVLYEAAARLLLHALQKPAKPFDRRGLSLMLGGVLLLCWLPYYVSTFPGTVSNDSISQLKEWYGLAPLTNANPILQTCLFGLCADLGLSLQNPDIGVALYCMVQAVLMAWLAGAMVAHMARTGAPRGLTWGTLAFYALCPIFPVFAFCVGKDTNFAMAVLLMSYCSVRVVNEKPSARLIVGLCASAVLCALLRNPGVYLAGLTLLMLLIAGLRKKRWLAPLCALSALAVVYLSLHLLVLPQLSIAPTPETENWSAPLQQVARVAASNELTEAEAAAIDAVLPLDELKAAYNGELSDPVKDLWNAQATAEQKAAFFRTWRNLLLKHPATCLSATFHNAYGYLYPGYMSRIKPTLLIGDQSSRTANIAGTFDFTVSPRSVALKQMTDQWAQNPLVRLLLSPGLYGWLTLLCAAWLCRRKGLHRLIGAFPALFTLAGCMLSAVNGYFRYAMPLYLCAPLLLWLCAQANDETRACI